MLPMYNTVLFCDVYESAEEFLNDYNASPLKKMSETEATTLFYLLFARYGNNPIANYSVEAFKMKLFATMYQYGPTWAKRIDIQDKLRNLTDDELRMGNKTIMNSALNPETSPNAGSLEELTYINQQNTSGNKKSYLNAYADLWDMLKVDVTEDILNKFKPLFKIVVIPEHTLIYTTEEDE